MTQPIRALLVEDNRLEARQTQHWLTARRDIAIEVETVERLTVAMDRLARGGIDVVLLDLNLPDSRGLATYTTLRETAADVPMIVLTGEHDESLGVEAVEQGAEDYLIKQQVDGNTLPKTLQYAVARSKAQTARMARELRTKPARVLSFLGAKGGVGTTTVAINVAVALAAKGKSVILAELKPTFGGLSFSLQADPLTTLNNVLATPANLITEHQLNAVLCQGPGTVRILYGSGRSEGSEEPLGAEQTEAIVSGLSRLADFVVLDLPAWPSVATATAARRSHYVSLVTEREPLAVRCGQAVVSQLRAWGVNEGLIGATVVGRGSLPLAMDLPTIRSLLGCNILRIVPPSEVGCHKAYVDRAPLVLSQPNNEAAEVYIDLARSLATDKVVGIDAA